MRGLDGYGRYDDGHIGCPRAKTDMTPCAARDGATACEGTECVGCGSDVIELFVELVDVASITRPAP